MADAPSALPVDTRFNPETGRPIEVLPGLVWVTAPKGYTSASCTAHLLEQTGVVTTPGNGFGQPGEGYIRMTVTTSKERLAEAVERIGKVGF